jgi:hypothetical protein
LGSVNFHSLVFEFCQLSSNRRSSVLLFQSASLVSRVFVCIEFINNTCETSDPIRGALICLGSSCGFRDCVFFENSNGYLVALHPTASEVNVTFSHCIFKDTEITSSHSIDAELVSQATWWGSTINFDRLNCHPRTPACSPTNPFTVPLRPRGRKLMWILMYALMLPN